VPGELNRALENHELTLRVRLADGTSFDVAWSQALSRRGIYVRSKLAIAPGSRVTLRLFEAAGAEPLVEVDARIAGCEAQQRGGYLITLEFLGVTPESRGSIAKLIGVLVTALAASGSDPDTELIEPLL
jgi:hypothetical protein